MNLAVVKKKSPSTPLSFLGSVTSLLGIPSHHDAINDILKATDIDFFRLKGGVKKQLRDIIPKQELDRFLQTADSYRTSNCSQADKQEQLKVLFGVVQTLVNSHQIDISENGISVKGKFRKEISYVFTLYADKKDQVVGKKILDILKQEHLHIVSLPEEFFLTAFYSIADQLLESFVIGGIFDGINKLRDFFSDDIVHDIDIYLKKYSGSSQQENVGKIQDALLILEKIVIQSDSKLLEQIKMFLFLYLEVFSFAQRKINYYIQERGTKEIIYSEQEVITISCIMSYGLRIVKEMSEGSFAALLYDIGNTQIFGKTLDVSVSERFYENTYLGLIKERSYSQNKKKLLCHILIFLGGDKALNDEEFEYLENQAEEKLESIVSFLKSGRSRYIHREYFLKIWSLDFEGKRFLNQEVNVRFFEILLGNHDCVGKLHLFTEDMCTFFHQYTEKNNIVGIFLFFTQASENIGEYEKNKTYIAQIKNDIIYAGLSHNELAKLTLKLDTISFLQAFNKYIREVDILLNQYEVPEGNVRTIIEKNKKRLYRRDPRFLVELPHIYEIFQFTGKHFISKLMWELFSLEYDDEEIYILLELFEFYPHKREVYKLVGKTRDILRYFRSQGFIQVHEITSEVSELVLDTFDTDRQIHTESKTQDRNENIDNPLLTIAENFFSICEQDFTDEIKMTLVRTLTLLNGYSGIYIEWLIKNKQHITSDTLVNIWNVFYFFSSLKEKSIRDFKDIEKVFGFITSLNQQECERRLKVLYEVFSDAKKINIGMYEMFKSTVLRYLKNGDEGIIDDYLYPDDINTPKVLEKKRAGGRLLPVSERVFIRRIQQLGFIQIGSTGGHLQYKSRDGTKHVTIPHSSYRDTVDKGIIKQLIFDTEISIDEWNNM